MMSIRTKITVLVLLSAIIPVAIAGWLGSRQTHEILEQQIGTSSLEQAELVMKHISAYMWAEFDAVRGWAQLCGAEGFGDKDKDGHLSELLARLMKAHDDYFYVVAIDRQGKIVASDKPEFLKRQVAVDAKFQEALGGKPVIRDVSRDQFMDGYSVVISVPIKDDDGRTLGVLSASLRWDMVSDLIVNLPVGGKKQTDTDHIMLLDRTGLIIACFMPEDVFTENIKDIGMKSAQYALEGKRGWLTETDDHGRESFMTYCRLTGYKDVPEIDWYLVLLQDPQRVFSVTATLDRVTAWILWIVGGVVGIVSFLFARRIIRPIIAVASTAVLVAEGDMDARAPVTSNDEAGHLATAFNTMVDGLQASEAEARDALTSRDEAEGRLENTIADMERQAWIKTGQTELNDILRDKPELDDLMNSIVTYLAKRVGAQVGAIYLAGDEQSLQLIGTYAFDSRKHLSNQVKFGQGLVGQAALERKAILLTGVPEDYIVVSSGLGQTPPRNIIVVPFVHHGQTRGVIELGALEPFSDEARQFLDQITEALAIAVNTIDTRRRIEDLLAASQQQSEELQAQQEQLHRSNEVLEEQAQNLTESEERLRVQQEELEETNQELEEQTEALQRERDQVGTTNQRLETTAQLLEEKAKDLEVTSRYKSEFLANMSHELRTPLNSLLILSDLLTGNEEGNLTDKQVEFARTINGAGNDLLQLINDILDLSKIESGKMELTVENVNVEEFLSSIAGQFQHVAQASGLEFTVHKGQGVPEIIEADPQRLGQVVKNLLSNAFKFTETGSVNLTIDPATPDAMPPGSTIDPGEAIVIRVTDTGIGVPEDKRKLIFEAFQQADGTTDRKHGGTGLGLSISRELVKLLNGEMTLTSAKGQGSCFAVILPIRQSGGSRQWSAGDEQDAPARPADELPAEAPPVAEAPVDESAGSVPDDRQDIQRGDKSILIIEDDPAFAQILVDLAHEREFKCLVAGDGETGLQLADYYAPTAALVDIGLPGMDGLTVISRLKEDLNTRHIPVHIVSGIDRDINAMALGATGFLKKPVGVEAINEAFSRIEHFASGSVRKLLVVDNDEKTCDSIVELLGDADLEITTAHTGGECMRLLADGSFDCLVLDLGLPDVQGTELLEQLRGDETLCRLPVVVLTGKELSEQERATLETFAQRVIIKGDRSSERLVDETALFLHRVEKNLPEQQRRMIRMIHNKETVLKGKTILIVDDDMRNMFALGSMLEAKGLHMHMATNGQHALAMLADHPDVDLVLMDIMMPEMDGYEATRRIRQQEQFKDLPIIALTAKAMKGDRAKCIEAGASDYLAKPVNADKLLSMLRVWLYEQRNPSVRGKVNAIHRG